MSEIDLHVSKKRGLKSNLLCEKKQHVEWQVLYKRKLRVCKRGPEDRSTVAASGGERGKGNDGLEQFQRRLQLHL